MTNIFSQLLSDEEASLVEQASWLFDAPRNTSSQALTEFEEQVWFEHQQQANGEGQTLFAWHLTAPDCGRLVSALEQTLRQLPDADVRYVWDDDAGLVRKAGADPLQPVMLRTINHPQQAQDMLLALKSTPFDLQHQPPLRFALFTGAKEAILGVVVHRLLFRTFNWQTLLQTISALYNGERCTSSIQATASLPPPTPDSAVFSTLCRDERIAEHTTDAPTPAGRRLRIPLPKDLAGENTPLASCSAACATVLARMTGHTQVALWLPGGGAMTLTCNSDSTGQVLARLPHGDSTLPAADLPPLSVDIYRDESQALNLKDVVSRPMLLPPGHTLWPLTLTLSAGESGFLELTVGAQLADWVGEYVLTRTLSLLAGETPEAITPSAVAAPPAPDSHVSNLILEAFREALGVSSLGEHDDFFDAGGHSLIATRVIGRLKNQHRIEININDLFSHPSAAKLAHYARVQPPEETPVMASPVTDKGCLQAPLSLAQQSLWKIYRALGYGDAFNIPFALRFLDPIDETLFRQAFSDIMLRHPGLRTLFVDGGEAIYQQVVPVEELYQYDWFWCSDPSSQETLSDALARAAGHHFELDNELPLRITFLRDESNGQQVASLLFHHIVLDEWSVNILMDELRHALASRSAGQAPRWQHEPAPFHAFALQQHAAGLNEAHLQHWLDTLRGAPDAGPIFGTPVDGGDPSGGWIEFKLDNTVSDGLYRLAKQQGASLFNVVYAGIASALHLLGGARELTIGTSASGRNDARFFDTIGYFTTVVAHRIVFDDALTPGELVSHVKSLINDSMPWTDIPIDRVEEALFGDDARHDRHMFEVFIQIHAKNKLNGSFTLADGETVRFRQVDPEKSESVLGLQFEVMEEQIDGQPSVRVMMSYRADHYTATQVQQIVDTTRAVFGEFARSTGQNAQRLDALAAMLRDAGEL